MLNLSYHTPQGVCDILPDECYVKELIEQNIMQVFKGLGYQNIQPPMFEYYDLYENQNGDISQEKLFKFFDAQGRILALRPDITTSIARIMATKADESDFPARLCYLGSAFRYNGSNNALNSEFTQAGIELVGQSGAAADAEVIILTIRSLIAAGLKDFQIDIGQTDFFKGLATEARLSKEDTDSLRNFIDYKDTPSIAALVSDMDIDEQTKKLFTMLPSLFGGLEVLDTVSKFSLNKISKAAIDNLASVYNIIKKCGYLDYVSIDLGMLQSIDYYTGIIFKGFTYNIGFSICGGGRYDTLTQQFSKSIPAVGVAISINRILSALQRQKKITAKPKIDALVYAQKEMEALAIKLATILSDKGYIARCCTHLKSIGSAIKLANKNNINAVIKITPTGFELIKEGQESKTLTIEQIGQGGFKL